MDAFQRKEEKLVSIEDFMNIVFPKDSDERVKELEDIRVTRQADLQAVIDERKKKDEAKEQAEIKRQRLISDFEKNLGQSEIIKIKTLNRHKYDEFVELIDYCKTTLYNYNKEKVNYLSDNKYLF